MPLFVARAAVGERSFASLGVGKQKRRLGRVVAEHTSVGFGSMKFRHCSRCTQTLVGNGPNFAEILFHTHGRKSRVYLEAHGVK